MRTTGHSELDERCQHTHCQHLPRASSAYTLCPSNSTRHILMFLKDKLPALDALCLLSFTVQTLKASFLIYCSSWDKGRHSKLSKCFANFQQVSTIIQYIVLAGSTRTF